MMFEDTSDIADQIFYVYFVMTCFLFSKYLLVLLMAQNEYPLFFKSGKPMLKGIYKVQ